MLGQKLAMFDKQAIRTQVAGQDIKSHWQKKNAIDNASWNDINWKAFQTAQQEQPMGKNAVQPSLPPAIAEQAA